MAYLPKFPGIGYSPNREVIDGYRIPTLDLATGDNTLRLYTKAKIIDMIGFVEGQRGSLGTALTIPDDLLERTPREHRSD